MRHQLMLSTEFEKKATSQPRGKLEKIKRISRESSDNLRAAIPHPQPHSGLMDPEFLGSASIN